MLKNFVKKFKDCSIRPNLHTLVLFLLLTQFIFVSFILVKMNKLEKQNADLLSAVDGKFNSLSNSIEQMPYRLFMFQQSQRPGGLMK